MLSAGGFTVAMSRSPSPSRSPERSLSGLSKEASASGDPAVTANVPSVASWSRKDTVSRVVLPETRSLSPSASRSAARARRGSEVVSGPLGSSENVPGAVCRKTLRLVDVRAALARSRAPSRFRSETTSDCGCPIVAAVIGPPGEMAKSPGVTSSWRKKVMFPPLLDVAMSMSPSPSRSARPMLFGVSMFTASSRGVGSSRKSPGLPLSWKIRRSWSPCATTRSANPSSSTSPHAIAAMVAGLMPGSNGLIGSRTKLSGDSWKKITTFRNEPAAMSRSPSASRSQTSTCVGVCRPNWGSRSSGETSHAGSTGSKRVPDPGVPRSLSSGNTRSWTEPRPRPPSSPKRRCPAHRSGCCWRRGSRGCAQCAPATSGFVKPGASTVTTWVSGS